MAASEVDTGDLTEFWLPTAATISSPTPTLVEVAEITDLPELPSGSRGTYDATHMKSGPYKERRKQPRKEGETVTIMGNAIIGSASNTVMFTAAEYKDPVPYRIVIHQGDAIFDIEGHCLVLSYKVTNPAEDGRKFELQVQWQDDPAVDLREEEE